MENPFQATTELYWWSAVIAALIDILLAGLLIPRIPVALFRKLRTEIVGVSFVFWGVLWGAVMANEFIWETCYQFVFSPAERWYRPPMTALAYAWIGWLFWWLALKISDRPVVNFLILGGLVSLPGHLWGMFTRGLMETPLLKDVSVESALTFGIFEFIFYWSVILSAAVLVHKARHFFNRQHLRHSDKLQVSGKRL